MHTLEERKVAALALARLNAWHRPRIVKCPTCRRWHCEEVPDDEWNPRDETTFRCWKCIYRGRGRGESAERGLSGERWSYI